VTLAQSPSILHAHGSQLRALDSARLLTNPSLLGIAPYPAPTTDTPVSPKRPSYISYDWVRSSDVKSTGFTYSVSERKSASNTSPCHFSASFRLLKTTSGNRRRGGHRTVGWRGSWPFIAAWWWADAIAYFLSMRDRSLKLPLTLPPLSRGRLAAHRLGS